MSKHVAALLIALAGMGYVVAQESDGPGEIARSYFIEAKPGETAQLEAEYAKHIAWHAEQQDTWTWETWRIITGERIGQLVVRTPGHHWSDFDGREEFTERDRAHFNAGTGRHVAGLVGHVNRWMQDLSRWPEGEAPLVAVYEMHLDRGHVDEFVSAISRVHEVLAEKEWAGHYSWGVRVSGGEVPTFLLVIPYESWEEMAGPEKTVWQILEDAVGEDETAWIRDRIGDAIRSETATLAEFVPELSYRPAE